MDAGSKAKQIRRRLWRDDDGDGGGGGGGVSQWRHLAFLGLYFLNNASRGGGIYKRRLFLLNGPTVRAISGTPKALRRVVNQSGRDDDSRASGS